MGKNKLVRFEENKTFSHLFQPTREEVLDDFRLKGNWKNNYFKNSNPLVLELGCGKGEYSVGLGKRFPNKNFIGIDIKGARLWRGAKTVQEEGIENVAFIRTQIELLPYLFSESEVDEIWITFPDPQIKYRRTKHRLTHPNFLKMYAKIMAPNGTVNLKTDSEFLHGYTLGVVQILDFPVLYSNHDVYHPDNLDVPKEVTEIQTHYEKLFQKEGKSIAYLKFRMDN